MLIRRYPEFNPFFLAKFTPSPPLVYLPPVAYPKVMDDNTRGRWPLLGFYNDNSNLAQYLGSGTGHCMQVLEPAFAVLSMNFAGLVGQFVDGVIVDGNPPEWLDDTGSNLPADTIGPVSLERVLFDPAVVSRCARYVYNIAATFTPRWQPENGGPVIHGPAIPFKCSYLFNWGGYAPPVPPLPTGPIPDGTEIIHIAFGVPYTSAESGGVYFAWNGDPPAHTPVIDEILTRFGGNFLGSIDPIGVARVGGSVRDVYPISLAEGDGTVSFPNSPYPRHLIGVEALSGPSDPPYAAIYATEVFPSPAPYWQVWKGPRTLAQPGAIGYIFHREFPQYGTESVNPPAGEVWTLYNRQWSR